MKCVLNRPLRECAQECIIAEVIALIYSRKLTPSFLPRTLNSHHHIPPQQSYPCEQEYREWKPNRLLKN